MVRFGCSHMLLRIKLVTMRGNYTFLLLVLAAAALVAIFVVPYLHSIGHVGVSIPIFVFLALLFIYGRHNPRPRSRSGSKT